jgi:hypothetical protein
MLLLAGFLEKLSNVLQFSVGNQSFEIFRELKYEAVQNTLEKPVIPERFYRS